MGKVVRTEEHEPMPVQVYYSDQAATGRAAKSSGPDQAILGYVEVSVTETVWMKSVGATVQALFLEFTGLILVISGCTY